MTDWPQFHCPLARHTKTWPAQTGPDTRAPSTLFEPKKKTWLELRNAFLPSRLDLITSCSCRVSPRLLLLQLISTILNLLSLLAQTYPTPPSAATLRSGYKVVWLPKSWRFPLWPNPLSASRIRSFASSPAAALQNDTGHLSGCCRSQAGHDPCSLPHGRRRRI